MKKMMVMLSALMALYGARAQSCLPEGITFSTQGQINSFQTLHPGCKQIEGDVTISGYNIANLNGLSVLTSIGGSLRIVCNEILPSLSGLDNLTHIGGNLYVEGNMNLPDLSGLQNVTFVGIDVQVTDNVILGNLSGLEGLAVLNGRLWIDDNAALTSLTGLNNLLSIAGTVRIFSNDALISFSGLENLVSVGGNLTVGGQGHLGGLGNSSLTSLDALYNLSSIGGTIEIGYNPVLESLDGLDNIDAGSILGLSVYENAMLSECEVGSICDFLSSPGGTVNIYNNAPGCNSQAEVEAACLLLSACPSENAGPVALYPNPTRGHVTIETAATGKSRVTIVDPCGQFVLTTDLTGPATQINLTGLPQGVYYARILADRTVRIVKIVKQ